MAELIKHYIMIENIDNEEVPLRGTSVIHCRSPSCEPRWGSCMVLLMIRLFEPFDLFEVMTWSFATPSQASPTLMPESQHVLLKFIVSLIQPTGFLKSHSSGKSCLRMCENFFAPTLER